MHFVLENPVHKMLSTEQLSSHLVSRGYVLNRRLSLDGRMCMEVVTPHGSTMALLLPNDWKQTELDTTIYVKKTIGPPIIGIPQHYLIRAAKEINGLTRAILTQGRYLTLLSEPFRPGPNASIPMEKYETSTGNGPFRVIPAVLLEELEHSEEACLHLCEKVSSRLQNWFLSEVIDARDAFDVAHTRATELSAEYFGKHNDILHDAVLGMRKGKDAGDSTSSVHIDTLERLHAHTIAIRTLCTAMETFRMQMTTHNNDLGNIQGV